MFGEAVFLFLGKNQFTVSHDFKNAAAGLDQFCLYPQFFLDGRCQTGSLGIVVSLIAVFDRNAFYHNLLLSREPFSYLSISLGGLQSMSGDGKEGGSQMGGGKRFLMNQSFRVGPR
jgi:hypothetical protein